MTILDSYDIFLVDMVGVVYDGITPFPGAANFFNTLIQCKQVIFFSNNPRPSHLTKESLRKLGIDGNFHVITSGDYMRHLLKASNESYYHLGSKRNKDISADISFNEVDNVEKASAILLTCFIEEQDDEQQFDEVLRPIAQRQLPTYCANPDVYALYGPSLRKTAGYFAKRLLSFGLEPTKLHLIGKPNPAFYEYAASLHPTLKQKDKVLMIGDTFETDIFGAGAFGIDSLLTLTGITGQALKAANKDISLFLKDYPDQQHPTHVVNQLF